MMAQVTLATGDSVLAGTRSAVALQCGARGTAGDAGLKSPALASPLQPRRGGVGRGRLRPTTQGPQPRPGPGRVPPPGQCGAGPERTTGQWARSPRAQLPAFPSLGWRDAGPRRPALLWVPHVPAWAGLGSAPVRSRSAAPPHPPPPPTPGPRLRRPAGQRPPSPAGGRQRE